MNILVSKKNPNKKKHQENNKMKNIKKIFVLLLFAIAVVGIIAPASATTDSNSKNKYTIESKEKTVKLTIKWNANGGKIGSKKSVTTSLNKGNKIRKLPTTPKRTGYTFKGWYSATR